jgi:predicted P-loop ATPase
MGHVSRVSHFVTVQPLRNMNLMSHKVAPSTTDIGSPIKNSPTNQRKRWPEIRERRQRVGLIQYAAVSGDL